MLHRPEQLYLVAYDIADPRRLHKVARRLEGAGWRVQQSVFHCRLNCPDLDRLAKDLGEIIHAGEDCIRIYPLCGRDDRDIQVAGRPLPPMDRDYYLV